jgi:hypothetical protein
MQHRIERIWSTERTLQQQSLGSVYVADGYGQGVGGVRRFRHAVQREQAGDHELDLLLGSESVARDGGLDGERCVLSDWKPGRGGGEQGDSADLAEFERRLGVSGEKNFFNGNALGGVQGHQANKLCVDLGEPLRRLLLFIQTDRARSQVMELRIARGVVHLDYAVAGELGATVYPKDTHG